MATQNVMDTLRQRGFIKQTVYEDDLYKLLGEKSVTFYIGFDPTADSLHVGHFVQLVAMAHMQKAGHRPIALIGGGTAYIGDPSGRTDMRSMMTKETILHNCDCFKKQMSKFINFSQEKALMVNNADWLLNLNYIEYKDERINDAKVRLAYELTKLVHGEDAANTAKSQAEAAFGGNTDDMRVLKSNSDNVIDLLIEAGFAKSKGDARRLIEGGGVSVDDVKVNTFDFALPKEFVLHKGKKARIKIERN